ncbi:MULTISPECIES: hypothetical protein [Bacillus cereus group]|uniref:hypothetical protein n=1 Tax=Bacillus cereus group TaxID=86661 RepID=UPI0012989E8C|nr:MULTISPECIES: hypothetical protein [Bacillus cereus group]MCR6787888.1 hypothetical protein [Bacillus thuringiensis]MCR6822426.1 hypothetical protein [Bacillus thuringiensis]MCR6829964.1 hypothetical protein [Bacillus thuringiensis]MEB8931066.1 hypothetical protein [Bacillus cereus]MEB9324990.1 hypothetical protein [Bacillus cereus]
MQKNSELYKQLRLSGYSRNIKRYSLESYFDFISGTEDEKYLELHLEIVRRIQRKYKHNDETMVTIIDYVLTVSNGVLYCRYIEYIACMVIGEGIDRMVDLLKYLYNKKPLWQEIERGLATK